MSSTPLFGPVFFLPVFLVGLARLGVVRGTPVTDGGHTEIFPQKTTHTPKIPKVSRFPPRSAKELLPTWTSPKPPYGLV